jgi:hypothetical protein
MRAREAMFVWTPDREPFDKAKFPLKGRMAATTIPESAANRQHPTSYGACNLNWEEADDAERLQLAQRLVSQLIHKDNIPEDEAARHSAK